MHEIFLQRCCDLANLATAKVSPNPKVGAVLVHQGRIIGEGYHQKAGQPHAEVNCLQSVGTEDRRLIEAATLYVSLEPCCFHGRTPACTSLILKHNIPKVVIGQRDKTAEVNGRGVQILRAAGVEVLAFPNFKPAERIVAPRQLFAAENRPFTLLKYAQSADGFLAPTEQHQYWITNKISRRLVHFWRTRTSAIVIGAATVLADNPQLNSRLYPGPDPLPFIVDPRGRIAHTNHRVFERADGQRVIVLQPPGSTELDKAQQIFYDFPVFPDFGWRSSKANDWPPDTGLNSADFTEAAKQLVQKIQAELSQLGCNHVTVEGGAWLLSVFIAAEAWDEARVFTGQSVFFGSGRLAPAISKPGEIRIEIGADELSWTLNSFE